MDNIVLLTDFSPVSLHAARYAAYLARQYNSAKLVLCHTYPAAGSEKSLERLKELHRHLLPFVYSGTSIRYRSEMGLPAGNVNKVAIDEQASVVVTGLDTTGSGSGWLTGSETQNVPDTCLCPVLLVPREAVIMPISTVVLACDLEDIQDTIEQSGLLQVLDRLQASLLVVHVEKPGTGFSPEALQQMPVIQRMLSPYKPAYFYLQNEHPPAAIARFAKEQNASLAIIVRKRQSLFSQSFHSSLTRALAVGTHMPVLILHTTTNHPLRAFK